MSRKTSKLSYHGSPNHHHQQQIHSQTQQLLRYHHHQQQQQQKEDDNEQQQEEEEEKKQEVLIPGLPDHIAHLILTKIPPSILYSVCYLWRNFIYTPLYPPFYSLYTLLTPVVDDNTHNNSSSSSPSNPQQVLTEISFFTFDPVSSQWHPLPPPPPLSFLLRHPPFISRDLPVQSVVVCDRLAVVAGTTQHLTPALPRPLVFDPLTRDWGYGPSIQAPRRWCATGALNGSLYMVSGVGPQFSTDTARSVERWDLLKGRDTWEKLGPLWDGRFSREAADAIGWGGRLCMVNVKGDTAKQGAVYSALHDSWEDMKGGMIAGWRGPVASMHEEVIYVVDESKGVVRRYVEERDAWVDVVESERLRGAKQMAARGGRLCVVCSGGSEIVVVDVVATPPKMWVVEPPPGFNVAAVHVLPRMSGTHSCLI